MFPVFLSQSIKVEACLALSGFLTSMVNQQIFRISKRYCKFVKQIGQGTREEKARRVDASESCWSGGYGQQAAAGSQPERRKSGQSKSVSGLPGGCVLPCHYVWVCKDGSVYAGYPTRRRFSQKGLDIPFTVGKTIGKFKAIVNLDIFRTDTSAGIPLYQPFQKVS